MTKLSCWKLRTMPLISGHQEKNAKQSRPAAMNAYAMRLSPTRLRITPLVLGALLVASAVTAICCPPVRGRRLAGRRPRESLLDAGQDLVHLGLGVGEQLVDVRVLVGEHLLH